MQYKLARQLQTVQINTFLNGILNGSELSWQQGSRDSKSMLFLIGSLIKVSQRATELQRLQIDTCLNKILDGSEPFGNRA